MYFNISPACKVHDIASFKREVQEEIQQTGGPKKESITET